MSTRIVTVSMDDSLKTVRERFEQHRFHHLLVVDRSRLVGVISDRDLLKHLSPFVGNSLTERAQDVATLQRRVHQIMTRKLVTIPIDSTLDQAVAAILEHSISCLPVVDDRTRPVGIVTWRDILRTINEPA